MWNFMHAERQSVLRVPRGRLQQGVTSIEYALLASLIALAVIAGLSVTGDANALSWDVWAAKVVAALGR